MLLQYKNMGRKSEVRLRPEFRFARKSLTLTGRPGDDQKSNGDKHFPCLMSSEHATKPVKNPEGLVTFTVANFIKLHVPILENGMKEIYSLLHAGLEAHMNECCSG